MGSGYKNFGAEVLTSNDVDGYLMRQTAMTFASSAARDSALSGVLDEGMVAYLEDTDTVTVYNGSAWVTSLQLTTWTSYSPTLTASSSNPTLGSGGATSGAWIRTGRNVDFWANILFGSSGTAAGSGTYRISLPVTARTEVIGWIIGGANLNQGGTARNRFVQVGAGGTYVEMQDQDGSGVTHASPLAWSSNGFLRVTGSYEAAS